MSHMSTIYVVMFFLFFMFSLLISVSHRQYASLRFAYVSRISCITCMNSLYTVAQSLSLSFADDGGAFIRLCEPILFVHTKTGSAARRTAGRLSPHFITERSFDSYVLFAHIQNTRANVRETSFGRFFRAVSFRASSRERSARSVASLALRRSPSYKTRSAGYTTRSRSYLADERRRKKKDGKINMLFWNELHRRVDIRTIINV